MAASASQCVAGLSIGHRWCSVGVSFQGREEIALSEDGNSQTPACVAVSPDGTVLVGHQAKSARAPEYFVVHNLLHLLETDEVLPAEVLASEFKGAREDAVGGDRVVMLMSHLVRALLDDAERCCGAPIEGVTSCIPASFGDRERQSMKAAVEMAGVKSLRLIYAPTAVLIAEPCQAQCCVVFDVGASTAQATLYAVEDGIYEILERHDASVGGEDIDEALASHFLEVLQRDQPEGEALEGATKASLRVRCEKAKKTLSSQESATVEFSTGAKTFSHTFTRESFEAITKTVLDRCLEPLLRLLEGHVRGKVSLELCALSGGSLHIPYLRSRAASECSCPVTKGSPSDVQALGVARQGRLLVNHSVDNFTCVMDFAVLSIGVETQDGDLYPIFPRNCITLAKMSQRFLATPGSVLRVPFWHGERRMARDNLPVAELVLELSPDTTEVEISVTFVNEELQLRLEEVSSTGSGMGTSTSVDMTGVQASDIEGNIRDAEREREDAAARFAPIEARRRLDTTLHVLASHLHMELPGCPSEGGESMVVPIGQPINAAAVEALSAADRAAMQAMVVKARERTSAHPSEVLSDVIAELLIHDLADPPVLLPDQAGTSAGTGQA